jgi:hypothetical protein
MGSDRHGNAGDDAGGAILEQAFDAARRAAAMPPPPDLMARVLADAGTVSASTRLGPEQVAPDRRQGGASAGRDWLAALTDGLADFLGGWRGGLALTASAVAGLWIGYADPAGLYALALPEDTVTATADGGTLLDALSMETGL